MAFQVVSFLLAFEFLHLTSSAEVNVTPIECGEGTYLDSQTRTCLVDGARTWMSALLFSYLDHSALTFFAAATFLLVLYIAYLFVRISQEEYVLEYELEAPVDAVYDVLSNVQRIAEVHPKLRGISKVLKEKRGPYGAVLEWELETSAMWAAPWPLGFLKNLKTQEHVSTVAMLTPGEYAHIQNTGLKNYRGKIVPFYYLHWWELTALPGGRCKMVEYELLKGSKIKFILGATMATIQAHKVIQANLCEWARSYNKGLSLPKGATAYQEISSSPKSPPSIP